MAALDQTDALVERLSQATVATLELACIHIGNRLGFYRALADGSEATPGELAHHTGTAERYVREWLEQQAVAGFLSVDDPGADAAERRYRMPAAHRPVFIEEESPAVDTRLRRPPAARVADLACGRAWSSIALARA